MSPRSSFTRKIVYLVGIALLLGPLFWLSHPSTLEGPGGQLAQYRAAHGLSEAQLGDIDPTGQTIKLATLGLRGVAVNVLWEKANEYRKKKDWTGYSAVLTQIAKLEPHFIAVWRHQAWNLSYNVSVEFDDYRGRYAWVIKGIEFLKEGIRYNERVPILYWDVGWYTAQKIGRADESKQFREMFKDDDDYHGRVPREFRDNWLVGKKWFLDAQKLVDDGEPLKGTSPVLFHSDPAMCQMNYGEGLENDGIFGERAKRAWAQAQTEWYEYGLRDIPTSRGDTIHLNDREVYQKELRETEAKLAELAPGLRDQIAAEKEAKLTARERAALAKPYQDRSDQEHETVMMANHKLEVTWNEVAQRVTGANRAKALELAERFRKVQEREAMITSYRQIVNFEYWRRRAEVEQTPEALAARQAIFEADQAFAKADLSAADESFKRGLAEWRKLIDRSDFADIGNDSNFMEVVVETISRYRRLLEKRDEEFPPDFILQDILDRFGYLDEDYRAERAQGEQSQSTGSTPSNSPPGAAANSPPGG